jgi:hypothetical protein
MPWQSVSKTGFSPCAIDEPARQDGSVGDWRRRLQDSCGKSEIVECAPNSPDPGPVSKFPRFTSDSTPTLSAHWHTPLCLLICLESIVGRIAIETEPRVFRAAFAMGENVNGPLKVKSRLPCWRNTATRLEGGETEAKLDDKNWDYRLGYRSGWLW